MSEQLRRDLAVLMRAARADLEARQEFAQLSDVGLVVDDYLAARAKLAALAEHARILRQPLPPPAAETPRGNGALMPHELYEENPYLKDALLRKGD
jgi:hypothetical protein